LNLKAGDGLTTDFTDSTDGRGGTPGPSVPNDPRPGWVHGRGDMSQLPIFPAPLRLCGKRPPLPPHPTAASLRHEPQGSLLSHRWNRRVEIGSSSRPDATVRTRRFAALLGPTTICQMDRSDPIAPLPPMIRALNGHTDAVTCQLSQSDETYSCEDQFASSRRRAALSNLLWLPPPVLLWPLPNGRPH